MINWIFFAQCRSRSATFRWTLPIELSKDRDNEVIIVKRPFSILRNRQIPSFEDRITKMSNSVRGWKLTPLHYPHLPGVGTISRAINRCILASDINRLFRTDGKRIACYSAPMQYDLVGQLGEDLSVYLAVDDYTLTLAGAPIKGEEEMEKKLLTKIDCIFCISETIAENIKSRLPKEKPVDIHIMPNAYDEMVVNPELQWDEPSVFAGVTRPRIFVGGHVSERIDWDGIAYVMKARPSWNWVFVGPKDTGALDKIKGLNFIWHDLLTHRSIPALIAHADVCAVPYKINDFTRASNPLKAIEYLAMGAPVLSTQIPSLKQYGDAIEWVEEGSGESYLRAIDRLLEKGRQPKYVMQRRKVVANDTLSKKMETFKKIMYSYL